MPLRLVQQIGLQYSAILQLPNGEKRKVKLPNKVSYDSVSENAVQTYIQANERRAKFISAIEEPLFDTDSGFLEEGTYFIARDGIAIVLENNAVYEIESKYIVDGEVTDRSKIWL